MKAKSCAVIEHLQTRKQLQLSQQPMVMELLQKGENCNYKSGKMLKTN